MTEALALTLVFGIPIVAILTNHHRKVLEMKLRLKEHGDQRTLEAVQGLQREMMELRDTTSRFDMGFDTALQRIEGRVNALEKRVSQVEGAGSQVTLQG